MQKHKCGLCGQEYTKNEKFKNEYLILEAISKHNTLEYIDSLLEICPHCGLVRTNIDSAIYDNYKEKFHNIISSDKYRITLTSEIPNTLKKILLHEILINNKVENFELYPNINYIKWLYFDFLSNDNKSNAEKEMVFAEKKIKDVIQFEKERFDEEYMFLDATLQHHLYLIEIYRRCKRFNFAKTTIEKYKNFDWSATEILEQKWFNKELNLCKKRNADKL